MTQLYIMIGAAGIIVILVFFLRMQRTRIQMLKEDVEEGDRAIKHLKESLQEEIDLRVKLEASMKKIRKKREELANAKTASDVAAVLDSALDR